MNKFDSPIYVGELNGTCLGDLRLAASDLGLVAVEWAEAQVHFDLYLQKLKRPIQPSTRKIAPYAKELKEYLNGKRSAFTIPIDWSLFRPFHREALQVVYRIPYGQTCTYHDIAMETSAASFPYILRQEPGEKNALGHIKFMFPNRFSVYLHDTPTRHLFERPQRLYSSGCVRVDRPLELAERVLNEPARWDQERLKGVIDAKRTRWVHLKEPLAIILAYWTADAVENGAVRFRQDVYERDAQLLAALEGVGPLRLVYVEPPTDDRVEQAVEGDAEPQGQEDARTSANGLSGDQRALDL